MACYSTVLSQIIQSFLRIRDNSAMRAILVFGANEKYVSPGENSLSSSENSRRNETLPRQPCLIQIGSA